MKTTIFYLGTLIEVGHESGITYAQTYVSTTGPNVLADMINHALETERNERGIKVRWDYTDLLIECTNGNQHNEPLSIEIEGDTHGHEFLLSTTIRIQML